jgi:UDP-N-acetylglucosamine--dolichyl-phosphate N-acetylglucosaminephosphotransferase
MSGMAFAVVGILGHFSKTLGLFFLPQIFNFLLSSPQLFGLVPCPRHRVPTWLVIAFIAHRILFIASSSNHKTGRLSPSVAVFEKPPSSLAALILQVFAICKLAKLSYKNGRIHSTTNLTILNSLLVMFGAMKEQTLVILVILVQIAGSICAFAIRYFLAGMVYDGDRR